jgi:hypothetical protein
VVIIHPPAPQAPAKAVVEFGRWGSVTAETLMVHFPDEVDCAVIEL